MAFFMLSLCVGMPQALAQSRLVLNDQSAPVIPLSGKAEYLSDTSAQLTIQDVLKLSHKFKTTMHTQEMNFGYTDSAIWLKLDLSSEFKTSQNWVLEFQYAYLDDVRFYIVSDQGIETFYSGRDVPVNQWPLASRKPAFPVSFQPGEQATIYIRGASHAALAMSVNLMTQQAYAKSDTRTLVVLSLYYGMLIALGSYNLLLFIGLRQRIFLLYASFVFTFALAASSMNGIGPLLLWPDVTHASDRVVPTGYSIAATLALMFARRFLNLATFAPRWDKFILAAIGVWGVCVVVTWFTEIPLAFKIMSIQAVLTTVSLLSVGIAAVRLKIPAARIFVLAWALLLVGTSLLAIRNAGLLPSNFFTVYSMQIGSAVEMLLLSFALVAKFNDLKRQKEKAQADLVNTLIEQEKVLETRVAARTAELEQAKSQLEVHVTVDPLTGILNRRGLNKYFEKLKLQTRHEDDTAVVVLIDLDEFKPVNDLYGHEAGDMLLQTLALRMKKQLSDTAGLGRLGGDEFVVLLAGQTVSSIAELEALGEMLLAAISEPVAIKPGVLVNVRASIGVSLCQVESHTLSTALRAADAAMYDIKHNGKNGVVVVSESDFPESVTM
ncbi:GGDEF domain-containing protein [Vibrio fluvialis]|nr:GGDEF domain-containing protein [Vibrio fluvialis]TRN11128.1 GGDEF domain-containing protein [Vibrio fluvialis]